LISEFYYQANRRTFFYVTNGHSDRSGQAASEEADYGRSWRGEREWRRPAMEKQAAAVESACERLGEAKSDVREKD
jgi:hypothetical protein